MEITTFVFEDEKCVIPEDGQAKFDNIPEEYSHLYLAIDGRLAAVICIEDPLREEAKASVDALRAAGISKIVMMTGDSERTAAAIARRVGVDDIIPRYFRKSELHREREGSRKKGYYGR
ncbi:MAG: HAD family hydrolase [Blautia faecis]